MSQKIAQINKLSAPDLGENLPPGLKDWERMQYKSFRKWLQLQLAQRNVSINDVQEELKDGTKLYQLLELLTEAKIGKTLARPKTRIQSVNNLGICFDYMHKEGIRLENVGVEDIADGNLKLIMGLIWTLVLKYEIGKLGIPVGQNKGEATKKGGSADSQMNTAKKFLLDWLKCIAHYKGVNITNLTTSFSDGKPFMAMVHLFNDGLVDYDKDIAPRGNSVDDKTKTLDDAFDILEEEFGVPRMLDPKDMIGQPDEKSVMTYLAACINALEKYAKKKSSSVGGQTDASKCVAFGPGTELASTAEPATFTIQAKDKNGNKISVGGDRFQVKIQGPSGLIDAKVVDHGDGTYGVTYNAEAAGAHNIEITLDGKHIQNSPMIVEAEYQPCFLNEASHRWSEASGAGTKIASDAEPANLSIQAKNKYGNNVTKGGDPFLVSLKGPKPVEAKVVDNKNGTYSVSYQATAPGEYLLDATLLGKSIYNSPHNVTVEHNDGPLTQTDPTWSDVSGPGSENANTVDPAKFTITSRNKYGNKVPKGGDKYKVDIQGYRGRPVPASVKDNGDGTYSVDYQPIAAGDHRVNVSVLGSSIFRCPFEVPVSQVTDPSKCVAYGAGTQTASTAEPAVFTLQAKDAKGNLCNQGGDKVRVRVTGPQGNQELESTVEDNGDGTYTIAYQATSPGGHVIEVLVNGKPISNGPIKVNAEYQQDPNTTADPRWSTATGAGVEIGSTAEPSEFVIQARNKYGNPLKKGGSPFTTDITVPTGTAVVPRVRDNGDGTYMVSYQATNPGAHKVDVKLAGSSIANSPFSVPVDKRDAASDEVDTKWSTSTGAGAVSADTATPAAFTYQLKNKYGNNINKGGYPVVTRVTGSNGRPVQANVRDNGNGSYAVTYQPTASGKHKVVTSVAGSASRPLHVPVTQETDPSKTRLSGPGTQVASTAEPATFTIHAADRVGNPLNRGGDPFKVKVTSPDGKLVEAVVQDNNDGTYQVSYQPTVPGPHAVEVSLEGRQVQGSPLKVQVDQNNAPNEETDPKWSTVSGAGTQIASTAEGAEFKIQARNKYGNPVKKGGDPFKIELVGPGGVVPEGLKINDNKDGTYTVTYQAKAPGQYVGDVTLKDTSLDKCPFRVDVEQNSAPRTEADPYWSTLSGPGVDSADTDHPANFIIEARNRYGNRVPSGGDDFKVKVKGWRGKLLPGTQPKDNKDGTYSVAYQPIASGRHLVSVTLDGTPLRNTPVGVPVTQITDPSQSVAKGAGASVGSTAEPARFTIQAKDAKGNKCNRGGDPFKVVVKGPAGSPPVEATVRDLNDGTYLVEYQPQVPGAHEVDVSLNGKPISNGKLKVQVDQNATPSSQLEPKWSTAEGPGTELASTAEVAELVVQAKNKYGNDLPFSAGPLQVNVKAPQGSPAVTPKVVDKGDGSYVVSYNPRVPGDHLLEVSLQGKPLFETPAKVDVEHNTAFLEEADPRWSQGTGPATEAATTTEPAVFNVQAKNKYGNKVTKGGDPFRVAAKGPVGTGAVDADISDNRDGTYTVTYHPTASGLHKVDVNLDGWSVRRAPYEVQVSQGTDPSKTVAEGPGLTTASTAEPANFTIVAKDKAGNRVTRGGDRFKATVTAPNGQNVPVKIRDNMDGTYSASYQPTVGGVHNLEIKLSGKPISNSPTKVNVEQRPDPLTTTDAATSEVSGAGTRIASTAEPAVFTIQAKNKFGNNLNRGGDPFQVTVKGPAGSPAIPATVKDNGNGTYTVTYQPKVPGLHDVDVTLGGKSLKNCPLKVTAEQNSAPSEEVSPQWSSAEGTGLQGASTTSPADFVIQARNKYGNPLKAAGVPFRVDVKGGPNSKRVVPQITDKGDGTYAVRYQPNVGGDHNVSVSLADTPIYKSPYTVPVTQTTDASKCTAEGAGTKIGSTAEPACFTIVARDAAGNARNQGGDPFVVNVKGPAGPIPVRVRDNKDGTYAVVYEPKDAGAHQIEVTLDGKPISGMPTNATVEQRDSVDTLTDPTWSTATGAGVELASTAEPSEFTIQARNKYGNPVTHGGDPFKVSLKTPTGSTSDANVRDNGNGTYSVTYQASVPGDNTVTAALNGTNIRNSPFTVPVDKNKAPSTESDPRWSTVEGDGAHNATIVEPAELTIQARNKYGNKLNKGGDDFSVSVKDTNGKPVETTLTDNGDGTYSATYQPKVVGTHELGVDLDGTSLRGTPLDVEVKQGADPSKTVPFGPGLDSAIVGEPAVFTVQAKDKFWNNVRGGGDNVQAKVTAPDGKQIPVKVTDNQNGTYTVEYTPQAPGFHNLDVTLDGASISDLPRIVPVKQSTDPSKSTLDGPGISSATTTEPASFTIHSKDRQGNPLSVGGDDYYVKITPPKGGRPVMASVRDNEDGSYTVTYQPTVPGPHAIDVTLNNSPVGGGTKTVDVVQKADPSRSLAYGPGFDEASTGNPAVFIVQARDKNGNNLSQGGDKVEASLSGPSGAAPVEVKDNGNGTYTVTATPKAQGLHTLDIKLNGQQISNSPASVPVKQDVSAVNSSVSGSGLEKATTGEPAEFTIQARDSSGAPVTRGGDKFTVKVANPEGMPVETRVKDNKDGTYTVSYTPYAPGAHKVEVALNGKPVGKSPYKVDVTPGTAGSMGNYEMEVWRELNKARMNPSLYAGYLKDLLPSYDQSTGAFSVPQSDYVRQTKEGRRGVLEAIRYLETITPASPLKISEPFSNSARDLVADVGPKGLLGNTMSDGTDPATRLNRYGRWKNKVGEILSYGAYSPRDVVIGWIIDDGVSNRPNRAAVFDNQFTVVGISSGPHAKHMTMCAAALAGNYVEGDEEQRAKREVKVNYEKVQDSFDKYETPDKKGYLIPAGNYKVKVTQLKLFKEGRQLHLVKTVPNEDGDPLTSDYRWDIPYDFEPISVTCKMHPLTDEVFLYLSKPVGSLDPDQEVQITSFTIGPNPKRPNNKMDMKSAQNADAVMFQCFSSTCREDITVFLKGKSLILTAKRYEVGEDEEGEFTNVTTSKRTVNLPFPVTMSAFSLVKGEEEFTIKILKPTSSVSPDAQVEIPIQVGTFDD